MFGFFFCGIPVLVMIAWRDPQMQRWFIWARWYLWLHAFIMLLTFATAFDARQWFWALVSFSSMGLSIYWLLWESFDPKNENSLPFVVKIKTALQAADPADAIRRHEERKKSGSDYVSNMLNARQAEAHRLKVEQETAEMEAEAELLKQAEKYEEARRHLDAMKKRGRWQR